MNNRDFLVQRMEHFLRCRLAEESYRKEKEFRPSMTISRQCGAGVDRIGPGLLEFFDEVDDSSPHGWALFDQSLVGKIIEDHKLPDSVETYMGEETKFQVVDALEELLNLHPSEWTLFNYSSNTIRKLCQMGNVIVVGRAGNFVTADLPNTFHVRLVGSLENRVERAKIRYGISNLEARKLVRESDKGRAAFVKRYTDSDIDDSQFYHLVVNTDNMTDEVLIRILGDTLLEWASEKDRNPNESGPNRAKSAI